MKKRSPHHEEIKISTY